MKVNQQDLVTSIDGAESSAWGSGTDWADTFSRLDASSATLPVPQDVVGDDVIDVMWQSDTSIRAGAEWLREIDHTLRTIDVAIEEHGTAHHSRLLRQLHDHYALTWGEIAALFDVSRRAVHKWIDGRPMNTRNHTRLEELANQLDAVQGETPEIRRSRLLSPSEVGGVSLYQQLLKEAPARHKAGVPALIDRMVSVDPGTLHVPQPVVEDEIEIIDTPDGSAL